MIGTLVLSQGRLATELIEAARTIVGTVPACEALELGWQASKEECVERIEAAIERLETGSGVLILTDMHGSTPFNAAQELARNHHVAVLAGTNLPMVVRLACCRPDTKTLEELADWIESKGRSSILSSGEAPESALACEQGELEE